VITRYHTEQYRAWSLPPLGQKRMAACHPDRRKSGWWVGPCHREGLLRLCRRQLFELDALQWSALCAGEAVHEKRNKDTDNFVTAMNG
jgi:hypothetical protein